MTERERVVLDRLKAGYANDAGELPTTDELAMSEPPSKAETDAANKALREAAAKSKQEWIREGFAIFSGLARAAMASQTGGLAG